MTHAFSDAIKPDGMNRRDIDIATVMAALLPHMPGWTCAAPDNWRASLVRTSDDMRLFLRADTKYGKEMCIEASIGRYHDAKGRCISPRDTMPRDWVEPKARMNIEKKTPEQIAKDIMRRVVEPAAPFIATLAKRKAEVEQGIVNRNAVLDSIEKNSDVYSWHNLRPERVTDTVYVSTRGRGPSITVDEYGNIRCEYMTLWACDVDAFADFLRAINKNSKQED